MVSVLFVTSPSLNNQHCPNQVMYHIIVIFYLLTSNQLGMERLRPDEEDSLMSVSSDTSSVQDKRVRGPLFVFTEICESALLAPYCRSSSH